MKIRIEWGRKLTRMTDSVREYVLKYETRNGIAASTENETLSFD